LQLSFSLAAAMNLVLGFLIFGMVPTGIAFMLARRMKAEPNGQSAPR
jgi:hypothetical protein